jgi:hypothetical protein
MIAMLHNRFRNTAMVVGFAAAAMTVGGSAWGQEPPPMPPGQYNVPPPPGYQPGSDSEDNSPQAIAEDQQYSYDAEQWAAQNCVAQQQANTATGVVIGGILGALVGASIAGRNNSTGGAIAGAAVGAVAGAAVASAANSSNPNCPSGYVLRPGAEAFNSGPVFGEVLYAAPDWYDPWIFYGNHWIYRPYPYHRYWYQTHH